jgi:hypothetical protein
MKSSKAKSQKPTSVVDKVFVIPKPVYRVPRPTLENCKWVMDQLLARSPNFEKDIPPEARLLASLTMWIGAHGRSC